MHLCLHGTDKSHVVREAEEALRLIRFRRLRSSVRLNDDPAFPILRAHRRIRDKANGAAILPASQNRTGTEPSARSSLHPHTPLSAVRICRLTRYVGVNATDVNFILSVDLAVLRTRARTSDHLVDAIRSTDAVHENGF